MIKKRIDLNYKVDPYGTEEILSDESVSLCPVLSIDYGDEVQEAEFTKRPTKGGLDTNINDVAVINAIKGNTIAWNQLIQNGNFANGTDMWYASGGANFSASDGILTWVAPQTPQASNNISQPLYTITNGHKYYCRLQIKGNQELVLNFSVGEMSGGGSFGNFNYSDSWTVISAIASPKTMNGKNKEIYIRPNYSAKEDAVVNISSIICIDLTQIFGAGNEPSSIELFESYYYKWFGKLLSFEDYDAGSLKNCKMSGMKTLYANSAFLDVIPIPVVKLKGGHSSATLFPNGIKSAGNVRDEIKVENGILKGIKKVGTRAFESGDVNSSSMTTDGMNNTNYALTIPEEYNIDAVSVSKIMLGNNVIPKVIFGNQTIFEQQN